MILISITSNRVLLSPKQLSEEVCELIVCRCRVIININPR
jgi:hypothetical protein